MFTVEVWLHNRLEKTIEFNRLMAVTKNAIPAAGTSLSFTIWFD